MSAPAARWPLHRCAARAGGSASASGFTNCRKGWSDEQQQVSDGEPLATEGAVFRRLSDRSNAGFSSAGDYLWPAPQFTRGYE